MLTTHKLTLHIELQEFESLLGRAEDGLLRVRRIALPRDEPVLDERVESIGQYVAGNGFLGLQELAEVALAREHQVADHEQRPSVADELERRADRAGGSPVLYKPCAGRHPLDVRAMHKLGVLR